MSLTSYQAAPPCNKGDGQRAFSASPCQRLSLIQPDAGLGISGRRIIKGEHDKIGSESLYPQ
jgi:hypothetical protein